MDFAGQMKYQVRYCVDTLKPALYRRFDDEKPGAMRGWELIAHEEDFLEMASALTVPPPPDPRIVEPWREEQ